MCKWLTPNTRPYGGALQRTALLDCGGFTPSGSRSPAPIKWRYPPHLSTPSFGTDHAIYPKIKYIEPIVRKQQVTDNASILSHVRKNEFNIQGKMESDDYVF